MTPPSVERRSQPTMYAIFEDGSHQFRVSEGDRIQVDRREGKAGDELVFSKVLFIAGGDGGATIGTPTIEGARVVAKIVNQFKAKKIIIQKFRRRKNMRRKNGHRQPYTIVQITSLGQAV
jgi:large subunit ribosomal protein L21